MSMYVAAAGDIVRCTVALMYPDQQLEEFTLGLQCQAPGAAAANYLRTLATQVYNVFEAALTSFVPSSANFLGARCTVESPHPAPQPGTYSVTVPGGSGGNTAPTQARLILRLRTDLTGRKYRGRLFLPTPSIGFVTAAGYPDAAMLVSLNASVPTLLGPFNPTAGSIWNPCIIHRVTLTNPVLFATTVTTMAMAPGFGTQRRSGNTGRVNVPPW
jgi:hypothetical protein